MVWKSDTRRDYARNRGGYASSTTDKEWERILPYLPKEKARGRPRKHDLRRIVDGIFYLLQSGCQWDMLPKDFPPWQTVYRYFRDWHRDGTWARLHDALYRDIRDLEGREESPGFAIVDSQSVKTGPDAREMVGFDAGKKVKGGYGPRPSVVCHRKSPPMPIDDGSAHCPSSSSPNAADMARQNLPVTRSLCPLKPPNLAPCH